MKLLNSMKSYTFQKTIAFNPVHFTRKNLLFPRFSTGIVFGILATSVHFSFPSVCFSRGYDHQVILDSGSGNTAKALLEKRLEKTGKSSLVISLRDELTYFHDGLKDLTANSRIYLIGHCGPNDLMIRNECQRGLPAQWYADFIAYNAPQLTHSGSEPITVSVVACWSGNTDEETSFGRSLSIALDSKGIYAKVLARVGDVHRYKGVGPFRKLVDGVHHKENSKIAIETLNGITHTTYVVYEPMNFHGKD